MHFDPTGGLALRKLHGTWLLVGILLIAMPAGAAQGVPKGDGAAKGGTTTTAAPKGRLLARVGNETITEAEVEGVLSRMPARERDEARGRVLNGIIELYVFANEARKAGMLDDPEVKERLKDATRLVLASGFRERYLRRKAAVSDEEVRKAYEERKANFVVPEQLSLQRILVKDKAKAEEVLARLKKGESFEELAKKESQDPMSASRGGNMGWQSVDRLPPALRKSATALKVGELGGPVQSSNGYFIIKFLGKKDKRQASFDEIKDRLKFTLQMENYRRLRKEYLDKADAQIFLPEEPRPQPEGQGSDKSEPAGG
jgi:peptidyl-prolyl cis-trans isomerase C